MQSLNENKELLMQIKGQYNIFISIKPESSCMFISQFFFFLNSRFHTKEGDDSNIPGRQPEEASTTWLVTKSLI